MYKISSFVFWVALGLYIITLLTVSYVGVYLTYIAIPVIVVSGLIMRVAKPKYKKPTSELAKATSEVLDGLSSGLDQLNNSLEKFSKKMELINKRTNHLKAQKSIFRDRRIEPSIKLKYAKNEEDIEKYAKITKGIDAQMSVIDGHIDEIKQQCELEIENRSIT